MPGASNSKKFPPRSRFPPPAFFHFPHSFFGSLAYEDFVAARFSAVSLRLECGTRVALPVLRQGLWWLCSCALPRSARVFGAPPIFGFASAPVVFSMGIENVYSTTTLILLLFLLWLLWL